MWFRSLLLTLLISWTAAPAFAGQQQLVYDIFAGSRQVGTRTVDVRVLPPDGDTIPETRLITAITRFDAKVAGMDYRLHSRADARVTDRKISFVTTTVTNDQPVEIQARQDSNGMWLVTAVTRGSVQEMRYRKMDVSLTSLDLFDPTRRQLLDPERGKADVLLAETGTVVEGPVRDSGNVTVQVGTTSVVGHRIEFGAPTGTIALVSSEDGVLLAHEVTVLGKKLSARLKQLPPPRSWGEVDLSVEFVQPGMSIHEQEL